MRNKGRQKEIVTIANDICAPLLHILDLLMPMRQPHPYIIHKYKVYIYLFNVDKGNFLATSYLK